MLLAAPDLTTVLNTCYINNTGNQQQCSMEQKKEKFTPRNLWSVTREAAISWNKNDPYRLSAVVAYYAILSLPGLLVIIIHLLSYFWANELIEGKIYLEIKDTMGASAADSMRTIFENARAGEAGIIPTIIGIGALVYGATGVFYHLQKSMNKVWDVVSRPESGFIRFLIDRARSFGFVLILGFLLLISFVVSALLSALQDQLTALLPGMGYHLIQLADVLISLTVVSVLFALFYKFMPDVVLRWRNVWPGAILAAMLFALGKEILSFYFGEASPGSVYGAAGSIIIILLWVSYSCLILFFGAEFTKSFSRKFGFEVSPKSHAMYETDYYKELLDNSIPSDPDPGGKKNTEKL